MSKTYKTNRFSKGDRVVPRGQTRDNLTYGYVRDVTDRGYLIYWPELGEAGTGWDDHDLA